MPAAIDVGSNTVRLLIGSAEDGQVRPTLYLRRITRLGGGMTVDHGLTPAARHRTLEVLREFGARCQAEGIEMTRAVGTAALRDAGNGSRFAREVCRETGLPLEIISGAEEARLTTKGVLAALTPIPAAALIIDIGGGSTEIILTRQGRPLWWTSLALGVVRLVEDCPESCAMQERIEAALEPVVDRLRGWAGTTGIFPDNIALIGTAGTATTLAALDLEMETYDWRQVNNYRLTTGRVAALRARLKPLTPAARERMPGMEAGRGDLIVAGIDILLTLLDRLQSRELIVSDFGLLEGLLLSIDERC